MLKVLVSGEGQATRRTRLVELFNTLADEESLSVVTGEDALIDCSLLLMASGNDVLMERLNKYLDTDELMRDIQHVQRTFDIREAAQRLEASNAGI